MVKSIQAIRGMNDIKPDDIPLWQYVEHVFRKVLKQYGYQEIRTPVLESTALFQRGVGEHTDIVEKEMYTFLDRNAESITLRPEFTAGIVRAGNQHGLFFNQMPRLWTLGPLFRYERPQKGRYRQFHQLSVECFGIKAPEADAEIILLSSRLWKILGLTDKINLEISTLGTLEERKNYKQSLVNYLEKHIDSLDKDSQRRLKTNPLRILDSKDETTSKIIQNGPKIYDSLGDESKEEFSKLCNILKKNNIHFTVNQSLVRGIDYYCKTVFEWTTNALGAQGTVCGGGRYDSLSTLLGGKPVPACGFGLGIERLILLLKQSDKIPSSVYNLVDIMLVAGADVSDYAFELTEKMRDVLPELKIQAGIEGSFKSQLKRADRSGACFAVILGENEMLKNMVTIKNLREKKDQITCSFEEMVKILKLHFSKKL